jgi:hypothetical protein
MKLRAYVAALHARFIRAACFLAVLVSTGWAADCSLTTISAGPPKVVACTDTTATTITVPADWNSASNTIEVIGGGGGGSDGFSGNDGGSACGGNYAKKTNVALTQSAQVGIKVGIAGVRGADGTAGGDSFVCNSTSNCASVAGSAVQVAGTGGGHATGPTKCTASTTGSVGTTSTQVVAAALPPMPIILRVVLAAREDRMA